MGGGFAGDVHPGGLGLADEGDALLGGDVADVVGAAGLGGQGQVPLKLPVFALAGDAPMAMAPGVGPVMDVPAPKKGVVLAVGGDDLAHPQALYLRHGPAHHLLRLDSPAVVGKGDDRRGQSR